MLNNKNIALLGLLGSGKTTTATKIIEQNKDIEYVRVSLAGVLKEIYTNTFGEFSKQDRDPIIQLANVLKTPLMGLDIIGNNIASRVLNKHPNLLSDYGDIIFDENFFSNYVAQKYATEIKEGRIVIDDMRFPHEIDFFSKLNFEFRVLEVSDNERFRRLNLRDELSIIQFQIQTNAEIDNFKTCKKKLSNKGLLMVFNDDTVKAIVDTDNNIDVNIVNNAMLI